MNLLNRIATYFKEWNGIEETAPKMELDISELRYVASLNAERCRLEKENRILKECVLVHEMEEELKGYVKKLSRLKKHEAEEPNNAYHDWDAEIRRCERNIAECVLEYLDQVEIRW